MRRCEIFDVSDGLFERSQRSTHFSCVLAQTYAYVCARFMENVRHKLTVLEG
jgi:hypothetical protein